MQVTAEVQRDGAFWFIRVPEVDGALTQARALDEVRSQAADAVATLLDVPVDQVEVSVQLIVDAEVEAAIREAEQLREESAAANARAAARVRDAVRVLRAAGWTQRDIGGALNVSVQRANQLAAEAQHPSVSARAAIGGFHDRIAERRNRVIDEMVARSAKSRTRERSGRR